MMKRNYVAPDFCLVEMEIDKSLLNSSYIDITDKPITDPATNKKDMWGKETPWK